MALGKFGEFLAKKKDDAFDRFIAAPKEVLSDKIARLPVLFGIFTTALALLLTIINVAIKIVNVGFTVPVILLIGLEVVYALMLLIYLAFYQRARKSGKLGRVKNTLFVLKFITAIIKFLVPIILLFTMSSIAVLNVFTVIFSIFSIIKGFYGLMFMFIKLAFRYQRSLKK